MNKAEQSFMWTTLPNGLTDDGTGLRVSVLLSPRLSPNDDPEKLSSFPNCADWPKTLTQATFSINFGGMTGVTVNVPVSQTKGRNRVDTTLGSLNSKAWKAIFHDDLFVRGFEFKDLSGATVLSYDTVQIETLVKDLYRDLAKTTSDELPLVSSFVDATPNNKWRELMNSVEQIDKHYLDETTGLRDPGRHFKEFRKSDTFGNATTRTLAQMQLFHTPPMKPKPVTRARRDDKRITASWLEYDYKDPPKETEIAAKLDFHQVVAAMNQYPTLLRQLGLVVDFVLDRRQFPDALDWPLSTSVTFQDGALNTDMTKPIGSPFTHARLFKEAFQPVSNPQLDHRELRVVDGLLDLNPNRFKLLQTDVDGAGLKLMNFARTLSRRVPDEDRVDSVTRFEHEYGAPALRTAGLMLAHSERGGAMEERFRGNQKKNDESTAGKTPGLWAEDLVRGFRFDIWDNSPQATRWLSLCLRSATYDLNDGQVIIPVEEEEGTVRMGATKSSDPAHNDDIVYLHEALVSWIGYSLAAPPPGKAILHGDTVGETQTDVPQVYESRRASKRYEARCRDYDLVEVTGCAGGSSTSPEIHCRLSLVISLVRTRLTTRSRSSVTNRSLRQ